MNEPDELERLSRLGADDLPEGEALTLQRELQERPDLREALEQLQLLDRATVELPVELDPAMAERLVQGALGPRQARSRLPLVAGAAALAAAAVVAAVLLMPEKAPQPFATMTISGAVVVNDQPMRLSAEPRGLGSGDVVETGANGMAVISLAHGTLRLPPRSRLRVVGGGQVALDRGTLLVSAEDISVSGLGTSAQVRGDAVVTVEPPGGADRVTDAVVHAGGEMAKLQWLSLVPPAASALVASGMTVFALTGDVQTADARRGRMSVRSGERWQAGEAQPVALAGAAPRAARRAAAVTALHEEVASLRAQRDALAQQRDALLAERAANTSVLRAPDPDNKYRPDADVLRQRAERGVLMFTMWMGLGRAQRLPAEMVQELKLSPAEEQQVLEASRTGERRLIERLGAQVGQRFQTFHDFEKAMQRLTNEADPAAPAQVAEELAGLRPKGAATLGSVDVRVFRTMAEEQEALFDAVDQILGPQRAARLVNAPELFTIQFTIQGAEPK